MENKRRVLDKFLELNISKKLELLRWLDQMCNFDFTDSECIFYEFNESGLESFFDGYSISEIFNVFRNSDINDSYGYFYKSTSDNSIVMCDSNDIYDTIIDNKDLITDNILNYIKEIKEDLGIDFTNPNELQLGDYVSVEIENERKFLQLVKIDSSYAFLDVDTFKVLRVNVNGEYDYIDEWIKEKDATVYYVNHDADIFVLDYKTIHNLRNDCEFLVYDKDCGEDFKVKVSYNSYINSYQVSQNSLDDFFYEEVFDHFNDAIVRLMRDYKLIKKIRE